MGGGALRHARTPARGAFCGAAAFLESAARTVIYGLYRRQAGTLCWTFTSMIFSRDYIGYLARRTVKHLVDVKMITTTDVKVTEERVQAGLLDELSLEDRINEEVRVILEAYSEEMRRSGAQYAEMFKKVKTELAKKYKAVL